MGVLTRRHHYHAVAKAFHWLVAVFVFFVWPLGFLTGLVKSNVSNDFFFWHESLGFTVFWLMAMRLCVRFLTATPAKPLGMPRWQKITAYTNQWLLYIALLCQPVIGFLLTNAHGFAFRWFGVIPVWSPIGQSSALGSALAIAHQYLAWLILALIVLHIGGALYHRVVRGDDTLARMT